MPITEKERIRKQRYRERRKADPERYAAYLAKRRDYDNRPEVRARGQKLRLENGAWRPLTPEAWAKSRLRHIVDRHKNDNTPVEVTWQDLLPGDTCPVLGGRFVYGEGRHDWSPSVDRKDPSKGYVPGNVTVISWLANRIKNNCTDPAVFRAVAAYVEAHDGNS